MEWVATLNKTAPDGRMARLWYLKRVGDSKAEAKHRVTLGSEVVYKGYAHDAYDYYDNIDRP